MASPVWKQHKRQLQTLEYLMIVSPVKAKSKKAVRKNQMHRFMQKPSSVAFEFWSDYDHLLKKWEIDYAPNMEDETWHPLFVEALQKKSHLEYLLDILVFGEIEKKALLVMEYGKEVELLEQRISEFICREAETVLEVASDMEKPCSSAEVRGTLDRTENGGVKNSIKNCLTVFRLDEVLHQSIRYNLFTEKTDIVKPLWWHKRSPVLNETDVNYLMLYLEENYGLSVESKISRAISIIADKNKYHPIQEKLKSLAWDGENRIEKGLAAFPWSGEE